MISIIICSRSNDINNILDENIKDTIGSNYEMIVIDNSANKYSIFEAYNLGIEKSIGKYLCFIHDDIRFKTKGWGNVVQRVFRKNQQIGLLGVAGTKIKTRMPSGWWNCPKEYKEINILQHLPNKKIEKWNYGFKDGSISEVVAIDGVFMVMKKDMNIFFNTDLKGFHNYDLNICFECINEGHKIVVTNEILIEHFSNGNINKSWYGSTMKVHNIYNKSLPLISGDINKNDLKFLEIKNGFNFLKYCLSFGFQSGLIKLWLILFQLKPFSKIHFVIFKICIKNIFKIQNDIIINLLKYTKAIVK